MLKIFVNFLYRVNSAYNMTKAEHEYYAMNSRNYYWDYAAMRNKRSGIKFNVLVFYLLL